MEAIHSTGVVVEFGGFELGLRFFDEIVGMDVSYRSLENASRRLKLDAMPPHQKRRIKLLHGSLVYRDERLVGYGERWDADECILFAEGEVLQASVFGEQLQLRRRVEARVGESSLTIRDEVANVGHDHTPHMLLYHVNIGWPVVDEGSELIVPARAVEPRGDHPVEGYRIAGRMVPAEQVGGDFYDVICCKDGALWLAIGDVTSHGVTPGLIMMMAQSALSTLTPMRSASRMTLRNTGGSRPSSGCPLSRSRPSPRPGCRRPPGRRRR